MEDALSNALEILGGPLAVAGLFNISSQAVSQWDITPYNRVIEISRATDWRITPHQLRPDLYPNPSDALPSRS